MAMRTFFGKLGWYHQEWTEGLSWGRVQITAYQPRPFGGGLGQL